MLPEVGDFLDEVTFVELQKEEAVELVKRYNEEGRKAGPPPEKRFDNGGHRRRESSFEQYDNHRGSSGGHQNRGGPGGSYRGGELTLLGCQLIQKSVISVFLRHHLTPCFCQVITVMATIRTAGEGITETGEMDTAAAISLEEATIATAIAPLTKRDITK